jgi:transposase-like protein
MQPIPIIFGKRAMFIPHSGLARSGMKTIDQFAELLAEGYGVTAAARMLGVEPTYGNAMLQRIRKRLGPQAR